MLQVNLALIYNKQRFNYLLQKLSKNESKYLLVSGLLLHNENVENKYRNYIFIETLFLLNLNREILLGS